MLTVDFFLLCFVLSGGLRRRWIWTRWRLPWCWRASLRARWSGVHLSKSAVSSMRQMLLLSYKYTCSRETTNHRVLLHLNSNMSVVRRFLVILWTHRLMDSCHLLCRHNASSLNGTKSLDHCCGRNLKCPTAGLTCSCLIVFDTNRLK